MKKVQKRLNAFKGIRKKDILFHNLRNNAFADINGRRFFWNALPVKKLFFTADKIAYLEHKRKVKRSSCVYDMRAVNSENTRKFLFCRLVYLPAKFKADRAHTLSLLDKVFHKIAVVQIFIVNFGRLDVCVPGNADD